jgi:transposase-like protein
MTKGHPGFSHPVFLTRLDRKSFFLYILFMQLIPFNFKGVKLQESCWIDKKPYFTARAIGDFLEYNTPDRSIRKIVERNPHILQFSTNVKLTWVEGSREVTREVRVYDPIGFQLIVNKSNQPRAIAFQIAVAHLVVAYMKGEIKPVLPPKQAMLQALEVFKQIEILPQGSRAGEMKRLSEEIGKGISTLHRWRKRLKETGHLRYRYKEGAEIRNMRNYSRWKRIMDALNAGKSVKETAESLNVSIGQVYRVRKIYFKKIAA